MKKYVCFGAYEPKSIRTRIYVAIKHSFASFDSWGALGGSEGGVYPSFNIRYIMRNVGVAAKL